MTTASPTRRPQSGPPLLAPVLAFTALTVAYAVVNRSFPHPDASGLAVLHYVSAHAGLTKLGGWLMLISAAPLTVIAAVFYRRLRALGITAPGPAITLAGGVLAASAMLLSAMSTWALGRLGADAGPALARALADLAFIAGGPGYALGFGLLIIGLAMTGIRAGLLTGSLSWVGLALAAAGIVATLALLANGFGYLVPLVRFGGVLWLVLVAALLPRTRQRRQPAATAPKE